MSGILTLVPTPIDEESSLEAGALALLQEASQDLINNIILIEDMKPGRRRWIRWGLDRTAIDSFVLFNEHTQQDKLDEMVSLLSSGKNIFLLSDGGLPAFCDPGQKLVQRCHQSHIKVTASQFCNSVSLAIALSGFDCAQFFFAGFLDRDNDARRQRLIELLKMNVPIVLMDTPYRLARLIDEIKENGTRRKLFVGLDLNSGDEELFVGSASKLSSKIGKQKREFILIID